MTNCLPVGLAVRIAGRRLRIKAVFHVEHLFGFQEDCPAAERREQNNRPVDLQSAGRAKICVVRYKEQGFAAGGEGGAHQRQHFFADPNGSNGYEVNSLPNLRQDVFEPRTLDHRSQAKMADRLTEKRRLPRLGFNHQERPCTGCQRERNRGEPPPDPRSTNARPAGTFWPALTGSSSSRSIAWAGSASDVR